MLDSGHAAKVARHVVISQLVLVRTARGLPRACLAPLAVPCDSSSRVECMKSASQSCAVVRPVPKNSAYRLGTPEPGAKLIADLGSVEQVEVSHLVPDPLLRLWKSQRAGAIRVSAEGAVEWDETITDEAVREQAAARPHRGRHRITVDALWQRNEAVSPECDGAAPQILDTSATCFAEPSEWCRVRAQLQQVVKAMGTALERYPLMRRSEEHEFAEMPEPTVTKFFTS